MERSYIEKGTLAYKKALSALFFGSLANFGLTYSIQPLLPALSETFALSPTTASLAMSATTAGLAVGLIIIAVISGMLDRKLAIVGSLIGSACLMLGVSVSSDFSMIVALRAIQGILIAGFPAIAISYINEEFDPHTIGTVMGVYIASNSIGGLAGRIATSTIADFYNWHIGIGITSLIGMLLAVYVLMTLPRSTNFKPTGKAASGFFRSMRGHLSNRYLLEIYFAAFCVMGSFIAIYNFLPYVLSQPPYSLSQTAIGFIYLMYLIGSFSSAYMGHQADICGNGKILTISFLLALWGVIFTAGDGFFWKFSGLALFTFGFFGAHTAACSWVGSVCKGNRTQAVALYLFCYYIGASSIGSLVGLPFESYGWNGAVAALTVILLLGTLIAFRLWKQVPRRTD